MAQPGNFDFQDDLQAAERAAAEQEQHASELLREKIDTRARVEPEFRRLLATDTEGAVTEEAKKLDVEVKPQFIEETRQKYSDIIVGATDEEVTELVFNTLKDVERSFNTTMLLAKVLFGAGLAMTVVSFFVTMFVREQKTQTITGLFGAGGLLTLISYVVMNPLDRIRVAAANLVQIQIAYVAYYKQLNMLGGSSKEPLTSDDAIKRAKQLREGAIEMINALQGVAAKSAEPKAAPGSAPIKPEAGPDGAGNASAAPARG